MGSRQVRTLGGWSFRAWGEGRGGQGLSPWHYGLPGGLQGMGPSPASLFFPLGLQRPLARHLLNQSPRPPPACSTGHQHHCLSINIKWTGDRFGSKESQTAV